MALGMLGLLAVAGLALAWLLAWRSSEGSRVSVQPSPPDLVQRHAELAMTASDPVVAAASADRLESLLGRKDDPRVVQAWTRVAELLVDQGQTDRSMDLMARALVAARKGGPPTKADSPKLITATIQLAQAYLANGTPAGLSGRTLFSAVALVGCGTRG